MYSKEPVWLKPEDILERYSDFCFYNNITERRLIKLLDAFLLRGRNNRHSRKIEILQESFDEFHAHVRYTLLKQGSKAEAKNDRPHYLDQKYEIFYDSSKVWYSPKDILDTYKFLRYETTFTTEFIGELANMSVIIGRYNSSEGCFHILLSSFVDVMKYRDYSVSRLRFLPPPDAA